MGDRIDDEGLSAQRTHDIAADRHFDVAFDSVDIQMQHRTGAQATERNVFRHHQVDLDTGSRGRFQHLRLEDDRGEVFHDCVHEGHLLAPFSRCDFEGLRELLAAVDRAQVQVAKRLHVEEPVDLRPELQLHDRLDGVVGRDRDGLG